MTESFSIKYFDGKTPVTKNGRLILTPNHMTLSDSGESFYLPYQNIKNIENVKDTYILEIEDKKNLTTITIHLNKKEDLLKIKSKQMEMKNSFSDKISYYYLKMNLFHKLTACVVLLLIVASIFYNLINNAHNYIPESFDKKIGELAFDHLSSSNEFKFETDHKIQEKVNTILQRFPSKYSHKYDLMIVDNKAVNALALPNRKIILFKGLLKNSKSPEEVAAVIAHEISHIEKRHSVRQLVKIIGISFLIKMSLGAGFEDIEALEVLSELTSLIAIFTYSRSFEKEADLYALKLLAEAKIRNTDFVNFFERMDKEDDSQLPAVLKWVSTHPMHAERAEYLAEALKKYSYKSESIFDTKQEWNKFTSSL